MKIFITGGAGFIGFALIRYLIKNISHKIVNIDKLTYAGNHKSLEPVKNSPNYFFEQIDICDQDSIFRIFNQHQPNAIMHLAAESHVDRSIDGPLAFVQTNVTGTAILLNAAKRYWDGLNEDKKRAFRFHHISTDEVYGSLNENGLFMETTPYDPSSPYSASKASSDHLVRAWHRTYGFPIDITNCSNNYGPYQFPEKLIPLRLLNAMEGKPLPIYGNGQQIKDWLFVDDHAKDLYKVLLEGKLGETYNIGGYNKKTNLEVVHTIYEILCDLFSNHKHAPFNHLIEYVADRPGHDMLYAIEASKIYEKQNY